MKLLAMRLLTVAAIASFGFGYDAVAAETDQALQTPQSLRLEHREVLEHLSWIAKRHGGASAQAEKLLKLLGPHFKKEEAYVFPPLGLLPALAKDKVAPEMKPAIAMADRIRAEHDELFEEHARITDALNELIAEARHMHDRGLITFARRVSAHALNEIEVLEPAAILVGDYLKAKLPAQ